MQIVHKCDMQSLLISGKQTSRQIIVCLLGLCFCQPFSPAMLAAERGMNRIERKSSEQTLPLRIEALCSLYSKYEVCHPIISETKISANFPTEYLQLDAEEIESINIYDARRTEFNYILGSASTILFGPYGLIGFLAMRRVGDVDFGFTYKDGNKKRTAFVRFKNNQSAQRFGDAIKPLVRRIEARLSSAHKAAMQPIGNRQG